MDERAGGMKGPTLRGMNERGGGGGVLLRSASMVSRETGYLRALYLGEGHGARSPGPAEDCESVDLGGRKPLCARETIRHPGNACWRRASISIIFSYAFLFLPCHLVPPPFTFTVVCPVHAS